MPFSVRFENDTATLFSAVTGVLRADDVAAWEATLFAATQNLAPLTRFQVIDDLQGYEVADQNPAVHQLMRVVGPKFLAAHGFAVGFWRLYRDVSWDVPGSLGLSGKPSGKTSWRSSKNLSIFSSSKRACSMLSLSPKSFSQASWKLCISWSFRSTTAGYQKQKGSKAGMIGVIRRYPTKSWQIDF